MEDSSQSRVSPGGPTRIARTGGGGGGIEAKAAGRLADLYVRHLASARRLAYLVTGDRALAEDLVQDAFLRMFGRFQDLRDPGAFEAYLRRTVVNLSRKHFRRRKVERAYVQQHGGSVSVQAPDRDVAGEQALRRALLALPLRQRTAIVLRFYEDLSERQTADLLRCRPGTVKSLVSRGMEALRSSIDSEGENR